MKATILDSRVICRQPGRYIGWPTIAVTASGELLAVFSGDRDQHVCPFGKTFLIRSSDRGVTWSDPELVTNSPIDDRDTGICVCDDGTIVISWFTLCRESWRTGGGNGRFPEYMKNVSEKDVLDWTADGVIDGPGNRRGHWVRRSIDHGKTWLPPQRVSPSGPHGPTRCADGRLIFLGNKSYDRVHNTSYFVLAESLDRGATWNDIGRVPMFRDIPANSPLTQSYLCEPHAIEVEPGHLLGMARYEERPKTQEDQNSFLYCFHSYDGGRTWTEPQRTDLWGKPPHLLKLRDGRILVTYGVRHPPTGQRACLSYDGGKTWDLKNEVVLRDDAPNEDLGYPATAECEDGTLVTVYYQIDKIDEPPCLMATRWRL